MIQKSGEGILQAEKLMKQNLTVGLPETGPERPDPACDQFIMRVRW